MPELLDSERFVRLVGGDEPPWGSAPWSLRRYLEIFDETAELRPLFRVHLPKKYAHWRAERRGVDVRIKLEPAEAQEFERVHDLLGSIITSGNDPEQLNVLEQPPPELERHVHIPTTDEVVRWDDWRIVVAEIDGQPIIEPRVLTYYGEWQRYRLWALLEQYSMRLLIDPRELHPQKVFDPAWDKVVDDKMLTWSTGNPRMLHLVELLEDNGWLERLYRSRAVHDLRQSRVWAPRFNGWPEGEDLDFESRATIQTEEVRKSCRVLGSTWQDDQDGFFARMRYFVEFWDLAAGSNNKRLAKVAETDLHDAARWACQLFGISFETLDHSVGACGGWGKTTLTHVLRPQWRLARTLAERHLPYLADSFSTVMSPVRLERDDAEAFLRFLDANELWSWYVELSHLIGEIDKPTDLMWDRRFLHLRSIIILHEAILVALVDQHGTEKDRQRVQRGSVKHVLQAFLSDRPGWRSRVWQSVVTRWDLTQTNGSSIQNRMDEIAQLDCPNGEVRIVQTLLTYAAIRNFGSHRFSRDPDLLSKYHSQLFEAAVFTPLLYWKVATSLG